MAAGEQADPAVLRRTERWFVRRGLPELIEGYGFRSHVLGRMIPYLVGCALLTGIPFREPDWSSPRWILLYVVIPAAVAVAAWLAMTLATRYRLVSVSSGVATVILVLYFIAPWLSLLLSAVVFPDEGIRERLGNTLFLVIVNVVLFELGDVVTRFGVVALVRRFVGQAVRDVQALRLHSRALPMLLFVTLFFFFSDELWTMTNLLSWPRVVGLLALFAAVTLLAVGARLGDEMDRVEQGLTPEAVVAACRDTPLADVAPSLAGATVVTPLRRRQAVNVVLVLATRQVVQAAMVGFGLFVFFLVVGLIAVDDRVATAWIGSTPEPSPLFGSIPVALLRAAVLLAGFGSMYFAVTAMTDDGYRREFFAPVVDELERTLAVRSAYLVLRDRNAAAGTLGARGDRREGSDADGADPGA